LPARSLCWPHQSHKLLFSIRSPARASFQATHAINPRPNSALKKLKKAHQTRHRLLNRPRALGRITDTRLLPSLNHGRTARISPLAQVQFGPQSARSSWIGGPWRDSRSEIHTAFVMRIGRADVPPMCGRYAWSSPFIYKTSTRTRQNRSSVASLRGPGTLDLTGRSGIFSAQIKNAARGLPDPPDRWPR